MQLIRLGVAVVIQCDRAVVLQDAGPGAERDDVVLVGGLRVERIRPSCVVLRQVGTSIDDVRQTGRPQRSDPGRLVGLVLRRRWGATTRHPFGGDRGGTGDRAITAVARRPAGLLQRRRRFASRHRRSSSSGVPCRRVDVQSWNEKQHNTYWLNARFCCFFAASRISYLYFCTF